MDPLSIIVSSITLLTTVGTIAKTIKNIHNANDGLLAIVDELSDFERLLRQTKLLVEENGTKILRDQLSDLSALSEKARAKFSELEMIVQHRVVKSEASGKVKASKIAWTREASHIATLQSSLKSITQKLSTLLTDMSM
jgi:signal transduction histidine kinase